VRSANPSSRFCAPIDGKFTVEGVRAFTLPNWVEGPMLKLVRLGEVVEAIKLVRGAMDLGLKEAKDVVDHYREHQPERCRPIARDDRYALTA
jgi:hypothetical protein